LKQEDSRRSKRNIDYRTKLRKTETNFRGLLRHRRRPEIWN
jgi:hypothetical protein